MDVKKQLEVFKERLNEEIENKLDFDHTLTIPKQSKEMGINYQTFMKYVNGTASPNISNLLKMSKYYNVSVDYLIDVSIAKPKDLQKKFICEYTGLKEETVDQLNKCIEFDELFIKFIELLVNKVTANDTILADFTEINNLKLVNAIYASALEGVDFLTGYSEKTGFDVMSVENLPSRLEELKYTINGLAYELTNFIHKVFEEFTLINCGLTVNQYDVLIENIKRWENNE